MNTLQKLLKCYITDDPIEEGRRQTMLAALEGGGNCLTRESAAHFTASGFLFNPDFTKVLMVHHSVYRSYGWTGGHADGEDNLLSVAVRETMEETGASVVYPLSTVPLSLEILTVDEHRKKGVRVEAHSHLNVTFALVVPEKQTLTVCEGENTDVRWFSMSDWRKHITEPHMLPIYDRCIERTVLLLREKTRLISGIPARLVPWFFENKRDLPWRKEKTPYSVWISEIMLQQTRVEAVKEYYVRFLNAYPTVEALANAEEEKLLKLWEGLGYYNRARNLKKTAEIVTRDYQGLFPRTKKELLTLPGIGEYTAGAILSIAYGLSEAAVDGNVIRVLSRITEDFRSAEDIGFRKNLSEELRKVYEPSFASDLTEGLMELGATVCLPNGEPLCQLCPVHSICLAKCNGSIPYLPVKQEKKERKKEKRTVFVLISDQETVAVCKRKEAGLLAGLWEFPNVEKEMSRKEAEKFLLSEGFDLVGFVEEKRHIHIFTHVEWDMTAYLFRCMGQKAGLIWEKRDQLDEKYSLPTAFRWILMEIMRI